MTNKPLPKTTVPKITELQLAENALGKVRQEQKDMLKEKKEVHLILNNEGVWDVTVKGILTLPDYNSLIPRALRAHLRINRRVVQQRLHVADAKIRTAEGLVRELTERDADDGKH